MISPYKPIPPLERAWVEHCLMVMACAPDTRDDYAQQPVGMPCGAARPEYGPGVYDLQCQICDATWSGVPGDPCWWCERATQIALDHQIDLLLTPPDVHADDVNYANRMEGWAERMEVGVDAGLITQAQADTAWKRSIRKGAA